MKKLTASVIILIEKYGFAVLPGKDGKFNVLRNGDFLAFDKDEEEAYAMASRLAKLTSKRESGFFLKEDLGQMVEKACTPMGHTLKVGNYTLNDSTLYNPNVGKGAGVIYYENPIEEITTILWRAFLIAEELTFDGVIYKKYDPNRKATDN